MSGPRELYAGDATFAKSFNKISRGDNGEQLTAGFKSPKGREFVTMLLGDVEAGQAWVDIEVMLNELGFYRGDTLRTANQRLEGEVARLREAASDVISNLGEWCCGLQTQDQVDYVTEQLDKLHAALAGKGGE